MGGPPPAEPRTWRNRERTGIATSVSGRDRVTCQASRSRGADAPVHARGDERRCPRAAAAARRPEGSPTTTPPSLPAGRALVRAHGLRPSRMPVLGGGSARRDERPYRTVAMRTTLGQAAEAARGREGRGGRARRRRGDVHRWTWGCGPPP